MDAPAALKDAYASLKHNLHIPFQDKWSIAVFANRESVDELWQCIHALSHAIQSTAVIDVLVNGNDSLARQITTLARVSAPKTPTLPRTLRIWQLGLGDKAHAWNQYIHGIWQGAQMAFFTDGYVRVHALALKTLARAMDDDNHALAASGVPTAGSSAKKLRAQLAAEHGLHGNLHVIRGSALLELRNRNFTIPLGVYRTDSLIGAAIKFNLDSSAHCWDPMRIHVPEGASWDHTPLSLAKPADWLKQFRRIGRQSQGVLENLAIREHLQIKRRPLEDLPKTAFALVDEWRRTNSRDFRRVLISHPATLLAFRRLRTKNDYIRALQPPQLVTQQPI